MPQLEIARISFCQFQKAFPIRSDPLVFMSIRRLCASPTNSVTMSFYLSIQRSFKIAHVLVLFWVNLVIWEVNNEIVNVETERDQQEAPKSCTFHAIAYIMIKRSLKESHSGDAVGTLNPAATTGFLQRTHSTNMIEQASSKYIDSIKTSKDMKCT